MTTKNGWSLYPDTNPDKTGFYLIACKDILYGKLAETVSYNVGIWHNMGYWVDLAENMIVIGWKKIDDFDGG